MASCLFKIFKLNVRESQRTHTVDYPDYIPNLLVSWIRLFVLKLLFGSVYVRFQRDIIILFILRFGKKLYLIQVVVYMFNRSGRGKSNWDSGNAKKIILDFFHCPLQICFVSQKTWPIISRFYIKLTCMPKHMWFRMITYGDLRNSLSTYVPS